eukprot:988191-Prymnesium_polylepis.2
MLAAIVFGLLRTLQWGAYYYLLGDPHHVSPTYYSRVLGYNNLAIALVSDITPYGLTAIIVRARANPLSWATYAPACACADRFPDGSPFRRPGLVGSPPRTALPGGQTVHARRVRHCRGRLLRQFAHERG